MINVLICIPCLLRGGTEMQTLLLSRALIESGHDVEVICYFESDESVVFEFKAVGATVTLLKWPRSIGAIQFIRSFARIIGKKKPDIIHIQYMAPGLLPIIAARLVSMPIIIATVHQPGRPHGFKNRLLLRFGACLVNRFTCVSEAAEKSWFGDSYLLDPVKMDHVQDRRHFTIPNAVDIESIDKALSTGLPRILEIVETLKNKRFVGTVTRISHEKGIDVLIEAFAIIKKTMHDSHLLIVGEGIQMEKLKATARQLKIDDAIVWTGKLSWAEAMACIKIMDVVVVPSRFEGFGLTAVEAMACQKPVVASRVDGLAEIIQDVVNGFLVSPEDVNGLVERISSLLRDEVQRKKIGQVARKHVEQNYSYPIFRERIKALYSMF